MEKFLRRVFSSKQHLDFPDQVRPVEANSGAGAGAGDTQSPSSPSSRKSSDVPVHFATSTWSIWPGSRSDDGTDGCGLGISSTGKGPHATCRQQGSNSRAVELWLRFLVAMVKPSVSNWGEGPTDCASRQAGLPSLGFGRELPVSQSRDTNELGPTAFPGCVEVATAAIHPSLAASSRSSLRRPAAAVSLCRQRLLDTFLLIDSALPITTDMPSMQRALKPCKR
ncbi:hypothetical protein MAPG_03858 [Magnaporthiopsis poae ATCC 64411]|uniref:Uncharacterized protein n=1 Tax=Magnaporthiopsis poae (strain ATCC 64411 / 73-15) TaxID=644358 RepID=A0A0C4DV57_MAGP6|nr:hypothetical protein MAPG_03858 [Magnaporthiopsis poae ATCC 64411]